MLHKFTWMNFHKRQEQKEGKLQLHRCVLSVAIPCVAIKANKLILHYNFPKHGLLINTCNSYGST